MSNVAKLKKKAADFEARKQPDKALATYIEILGEYEDNPDEMDVALYNRVGDLLLKVGNTADAVDYYEKAVDHYAERGFFNNAIALCNKILRQSPGRLSVYYKLGKISAQKGFVGDAKRNYLEYADRVQKAGKLGEAFRALKEFADLCPDQDDIRLMLADQLQKAGKASEAVEQLQLLYGRYESEGRPAEAAATADRIRSIDPNAEIRSQGIGQQAKAGDLVFLDLGDPEPAARHKSRAPAAIEPPPVELPPLKFTAEVEAQAQVPILKGVTRASGPVEVPVVDDVPADAPAATLDGVIRDGDLPAGLPPSVPLAELELTAFAVPEETSAETVLDLESVSIDFEPTAISESQGDSPELRASGGRDDDVLGGDLMLIMPDEPELAGDGGPGAWPRSDEAATSPTHGLPLIHDDVLSPTHGLPLIDDDGLPSPTHGLPLIDVDEEPVAATPTGVPEILFTTEPVLEIREHDQDLSPVNDEDQVVGVEDGSAAVQAEEERQPEQEEQPEGKSEPEDGPAGLEIDEPAVAGVAASGTGTEVEPEAEAETETAAEVETETAAEAETETAAEAEGETQAEAHGEAELVDVRASVGRNSTMMAAKSVEMLRAVVEGSPTDWDAHRELGEVMLDAGDRDGGIRELEAAMIGYERENHLDPASSVADEIARLDPGSVKHLQKRVEYAFRMNDKHRLVDAYLELADALFRVQQPEKARVIYQRVLDLAPDDLRAQAALSALPEPPRPEPPPAAHGSSTAASRGTHAPVAGSSAAPAVDASGNNSFVNLGDWMRDEELPKDTRMIVAEEKPSGDEAADFADMLKKFKQGVAENVDEEDYQSHYDLGIAYKEMGLLDEAIGQFQKALRGAEHHVRSYEAIGNCFMEKQQYQMAATVLGRALAEKGVSDDKLVGVLYLLGRACEELDKPQDALAYYERVFVVDIEFKDVVQRVNSLTKVVW